MPQIPGISGNAGPGNSLPRRWNRGVAILAAAAVVVAIITGIASSGVHRNLTGGVAVPPAVEEELAVVPATFTPVVQDATPAAPGVVATAEELAKPWSAKRFIFAKPDTQARVPAMVIRLPGNSGYWAFALPMPYGGCELEYVTDLKHLIDRYGFRARHPMVVAPCEGTVYDPLGMGAIPSGAWVRGEVVQGSGIRPPTSIRIQVRGGSIIADQIE
jgi:hypothetical protein